jgi:hypothetical protein
LKHGSILFSIDARDISSRRLALGPIQPPLRWTAWPLPGAKRQRHKDGLSPQSSAVVKNEYKCTLLHPHGFTLCKGTTVLAVPLTSKQGPSSQIPSKYYLPYGKNKISHDDRAPIIVRVRSLVVFLSPFKQMPGQLPFKSYPILHPPTHHPAKCYVLMTLSES